MKIGLMSRLASLRGAPSRAASRHPSDYDPSQAGGEQRTAEWRWDEDAMPPSARGRGRLPWPRAALVIGALSLVLWALIFVVIGMLFRG
jgi:hypothetical protein